MEVESRVAELRSAEVARRRAAAEALGREGADVAVIALLDACADADEQVRELANAALEELGPPPLEVADQLAERLNGPELTGYWAATLLGRLGDAAGPWSNALGQTLHPSSGSPHAANRQRAAWALGQIGPAAEVAVAALEAASQGDDARLAKLATRALQEIDPSRG